MGKMPIEQGMQSIAKLHIFEQQAMDEMDHKNALICTVRGILYVKRMSRLRTRTTAKLTFQENAVYCCVIRSGYSLHEHFPRKATGSGA